MKEQILRGVLAAAILWIGVGGLPNARAEEGIGQVTCLKVHHVSDGDSLTCETDRPELKPIRVRIAGVDAPETSQQHWRLAQDLLVKLAQPGTRANCYKKDAYRRQVCRVTSPDGRDVGEELVRTGVAWHNLKYAGEQGPAERERYAAAEAGARMRGLGLWSEESPQEPAECRALKKQGSECR